MNKLGIQPKAGIGSRTIEPKRAPIRRISRFGAKISRWAAIIAFSASLSTASLSNSELSAKQNQFAFNLGMPPAAKISPGSSTFVLAGADRSDFMRKAPLLDAPASVHCNSFAANLAEFSTAVKGAVYSLGSSEGNASIEWIGMQDEKVIELLNHPFISGNLAAVFSDSLDLQSARQAGYSALEKHYSKINRVTTALDYARRFNLRFKGVRLPKVYKKLPYSDLRAFVALCYNMQEFYKVPAKAYIAFYLKESRLRLDADGKFGSGGSQITSSGARAVFLKKNLRIMNTRLLEAGGMLLPSGLGKFWDKSKMAFSSMHSILKNKLRSRNNDFFVSSASGIIYPASAKSAAQRNADGDKSLYSENMADPSVSILYTTAVLLSKGFEPKRGYDVSDARSMNHLRTVAFRYNTVYESYGSTIEKYFKIINSVENVSDEMLATELGLPIIRGGKAIFASK